MKPAGPAASIFLDQVTPTLVSPMAAPKPSDEESTVDELSENDSGVALITLPESDVEDVIGFSIGQQQTRMKSPDTPAFEKFRALDSSRKFEDPEAEDVNTDQSSPDSQMLPSHPKDPIPQQSMISNAFKSYDGPVSSPEDSITGKRRSNASKSILQDGLASVASRNSSDFPTMVGSLRKLLPNLPSIGFVKSQMPSLGLSPKVENDGDANRRTRTHPRFSKGRLSWTSTIPAPSPPRSPAKKADLPVREPASSYNLPDDGKHRTEANDSLVSVWPTGDGGTLLAGPGGSKLRRATSDNSLFLRNDLERLLTREGAEKWSNVSDHVNARFKAITDSIQDSAIGRMPRMPSINLASFKPGPLRSTSDSCKLSTHGNASMANVESNCASWLRQHPTLTQTESPKHQHPILSQVTSELNGDVVLLGGYRGSILRSATPPHKQLWVPVKVK
jgi:hypothetical protein